MPEIEKVPEHIALIMDGNRRWARERNLPILEGHRRGYQLMERVPRWLFSRGVKIVSLFAFSTENWARSREEVNYLMKLMEEGLTEGLERLIKEDHRLLVSGRIDELPGALPGIVMEAMAKSKDRSGGTVNICLNYGGRAEIVDAIKKIVKNGLTEDQIHEGMIRKYLYYGGLPDPDIFVRTSGEQRTSGFLLWQSAYSEFLFLRKYWPELEESDVAGIIDEYQRRQRRFGGD